MVRFGIQDYETEYPDWSKHHKKISKHIRRVYDNGKTVNTENEKLIEILNQNEDMLLSKRVMVRDKETLEFSEATDYFLPLNNLEYESGDIDYYSIGSCNTEQVTYFRMKFMIEDSLLVLSDSFKSGGSHACSFYDEMITIDSVENFIEDIIDKDLPWEEIGLKKGNDDDYSIIVADECKCPSDFEICKQDLLRSLVVVEIYKFEQEIIDIKNIK